MVEISERLYALASRIDADGTASQIGSADEILEIAKLTAALEERKAEPVAWPEPTILNPDIFDPTGIPYIDSLLHRLLDAQQDINLAANQGMYQSLCDASALINEVETCIRRLAATPPAPDTAVEALRQDIAEFMRRLGPQWFLAQNWFPASQQEGALSSLGNEQGKAPDGWKLVPVKPTEAMLAAGNTILNFTKLSPEVWGAMLAAAPQTAEESR
ncbi:hypothetical protein LB533_20605 [Mesorhizobium sp. BR1-1-13]|uniref:hypothetical protein n=1 Tax=Mesorhizobium sp. BR1-1-13 TaxID=2876656 RepID=UPI001CD152E8|nr:hypothetical protein [Mesorhizobium sp. BR1-1-13]MBZ9943491.1 hypothetical protein [Mesorhizobium sp. BR1-1-13]